MDVIDKKKYATDRNVDLDNVTQRDPYLTIGDIMKYTPNDRILVRCLTKEPSTHDFTVHGFKECENFFKVSKYCIADFICYKMEPLNFADSIYSYHRVANSLSRPSMFYALNFNSKIFGRAVAWKTVLHTADRWPHESISYAITVIRITKTGQVLFNGFQTSYKLFKSNLLPPPFVTRCATYEPQFTSRYDCVRHCLTKKAVKSFGKHPFNVITSEPVPYRHISLQDIKDQRFSATLRNMERNCSMICRYRDCDTAYTLTDCFPILNDHGLVVRVLIPNSMTMAINYIAAMTGVNFVIQIASILSIGFGMSVIKFNPFFYKLGSRSRSRPTALQERSLSRFRSKQVQEYCKKSRQILHHSYRTNRDGLISSYIKGLSH
ncbi:hypothetical protein HDE_07958 [Halotydeus destructor]|nr:hypothetical protein HDE_07958 [Halotydeus destructor]